MLMHRVDTDLNSVLVDGLLSIMIAHHEGDREDSVRINVALSRLEDANLPPLVIKNALAVATAREVHRFNTYEAMARACCHDLPFNQLNVVTTKGDLIEVVQQPTNVGNLRSRFDYAWQCVVKINNQVSSFKGATRQCCEDYLCLLVTS